MTKNYLEAFNEWKTNPFFDEETRKELSSLTDEKEIEDRFYCDLEFGTGGLRGVMGAGTNRMNKYTVGKATYGLGLYLLDTFGKEACGRTGVCIGYDTRNNSKYFAEISANILSGMGIKVYFFSEPRPTPMLSHLVKCAESYAGIVITASHNPKEYNGYKVYDRYGCQLTTEPAKKLLSIINGISDIRSVPFVGNQKLIERLDYMGRFVEDVVVRSRLKDAEARKIFMLFIHPFTVQDVFPCLKR